jgi:murein DD-endopeptidase MepM/ murein hydrolase activator NlpD
MRFHEIREFSVPGITLDEAIPGVDPVTGKPLGVKKPGVVDTIKDLLGIKNKAHGIAPMNPLKSMLITQGFHDNHKGVDLRAAVGTPLYAPEAGTVQLLRGQRAGLYIELTTATGVHKFMHLSEYTVPNGAEVKAGQKIGLTGNTGVTTGPHLHWEYWVDGRPRSAV